jgi:hypothetical protein
MPENLHFHSQGVWYRITNISHYQMLLKKGGGGGGEGIIIIIII